MSRNRKQKKRLENEKKKRLENEKRKKKNSKKNGNTSKMGLEAQEESSKLRL